MMDSQLKSTTTPEPAHIKPPSSLLPTADIENTSLSLDEKTVQPVRALRFWLAWISLCLCIVVSSMDSVIVAFALPEITAELGGTSSQAFWCGTGFLLAQTIMMPLYGSMSEIFGRKWVVLTALAIFFFGSILCATAQSMQWLIAARVVQGLGGGGLEVLVIIVMTDLFSLNERGKYGGMVAGSWSLGIMMGVILGGSIAQYTTWRLIFYINIPLCIVPAVGIVLFLHLNPPNTHNLVGRLAQIDWLGTAVFVASSTSFFVGLTSGGVSHPWSSANTLVPLILGFAGWLVFIYIEYAIAKNPMAPLHIFANRTAITGYVGAICHGCIIWAIAYYLILYFLGPIGHGTFHAALDTLPNTAITAPVAAMTGFFTNYTQRFKYVSSFGWAVLTLSMGLLTLFTPTTSSSMYYGFLVIIALGAGILFSSTSFAVQAEQTDADNSIASTYFTFARSFGQAIGVAVGSVVFQNSFNSSVASKVASGAINPAWTISGNMAEGVTEVFRVLPAELKEVYKVVYSDALRSVWYVMIPVAGVAFLVSLIARNTDLNRETRSRQSFNHQKQ